MYISDVEIVKEFHMNNDGGVVIYLKNKKLVPEQLGIPGNITDTAFTMKVLHDCELNFITFLKLWQAILSLILQVKLSFSR